MFNSKKEKNKQEKIPLVKDPMDPRDTDAQTRWSDKDEKILAGLGKLRSFIEFDGLTSVHAYDDGVSRDTTHVVIDGDTSKLFVGDYNLKRPEIESAIRSIAAATDPEHDFKKSAIETTLPGGQIFVGTLPPLSGAPRIDIYSRSERILAETFCEKPDSSDCKKKRHILLECMARGLGAILLFPHFIVWLMLFILTGTLWLAGFLLIKSGELMKVPQKALSTLMRDLVKYDDEEENND